MIFGPIIVSFVAIVTPILFNVSVLARMGNESSSGKKERLRKGYFKVDLSSLTHSGRGR